MKPKWFNLKYGISFLSLCLLGCQEGGVFSANELIEGTVQSVFGKPVPGAMVTITNTQFSATTDQNGHYQLDYVPGEFSVVVEKDGFLSTSYTLNISQKLHYPANPVSLLPEIPNNSMAVLDIENSNLSVLKGVGAYRKALNHPDGFETAYYVALNSEEELPTFGAGNLSFLDSASGKNSYYLFKLKADNKYFSVGRSKTQRYLDGVVAGEIIKLENIKKHSFELAPGKYAWVIAKINYEREIRPIDHEDQTIFAFRVE